MSKVLSTRIANDTFHDFLDILDSLGLDRTIVLNRLVNIFIDSFRNININACIHPVDTRLIEDRYQRVREQVDDFLRGLEADK